MATEQLSIADIPSFTGTWTGSFKGYEPGKGYVEGNFTLEVSEQKGRAFTGTFIKNSSATQGKGQLTLSFFGVIGFDNKTFYTVDSNGHSIGSILSNDNLQVVYLGNGKNSGAYFDIVYRKK